MRPIDLTVFALAIIICAVGVSALVGQALRPRPVDRLLLWFGLVSAIYGVRMFFKAPLAGAFGIEPRVGSWVENSLNYFILIPSLLFIEELYGLGWRQLVRWVTIGMTMFAVAAVIVDIAATNPARVPDPSVPVLAMVGLIVIIGSANGYQPPRFPEWRILLAGIGTFILFVINDHAVAARVVPWRRSAEPVGFIIQLGCFGYIALTRMVAQGRQLAAIEQEMRSAREIQTSILPRNLPTGGRLRMAAHYEPLAAVAGDFYDVVTLDGNAIAILVADVSGHGVPAALIASMVKVAFAASLRESGDPGVVLHRMNATLCGMFERSFVTAACVFVDPDDHTARYALAGHPSPLLVSSDGSQVSQLDERGVLLGMIPAISYKAATVAFPAGSRLILYSDGVTETPDQGDELFGIDRLIAFAREERSRLPEAFTSALVTTLRKFAHRPALQHDDITIVVVDLD